MFPRSHLHLPCPRGSAGRRWGQVRAALVLTGLLAGCHPPARTRGPTAGAAAALTSPREPAAPESVINLPLKGGLQVVLRPHSGAHTVALVALLDAGGRSEPPDQPGLAHVLEHLIVRGQGPGPAAASLEQDIVTLGGSVDAYTSAEHVLLQVTIASRYLEPALQRLAQALLQPATHAAALRPAVAAVLDEIHQGEAAPDQALTQALLTAVFPGDRRYRSPLGGEPAVSALTPAQVAAFAAARCRPAHLRLIVSGDVDPATLQRHVERLFAPLTGRGGRSAEVPAPPRSGDAPPVITLQRETRDAHLLLGFRDPRPAALLSLEDAAALHLLAALLGGGDEARLQREVQRNRQLASEVAARVYAPRGPGLLLVSAALAGPAGSATAPSLEEAAQALLGETLRLAREEVSEAELARARGLLEARAVRQQETAAGVARRLATFSLLAPEGVAAAAQAAAAYGQALRALTPARLREVAGRYLRPEGLTMAALQPRSAPPPPRRGRGRAQVLLAALTPEPGQVGPLLQRALRRALATVPSGVAEAGPVAGQGGRLERVVRLRLRSGARLLVLPQEGVPLVALRAIWRGGVLREEEHSAGSNHLLATLLPLATQTRGRAEVRRLLAELGGSLRGQAGYSSFGVQGEVLSAALDEGLRLFSDVLLNPALADGDVDAERRLALTALRGQEDDPAQVALRLCARALLPRHPYRNDALGTPAAVAALSRRRLLEFYRQHYPLSQATLVVVGDVDPAAVAARLDALLPPDPAALLDRAPPRPVAAAAVAGEAPAAGAAPRQIIKTMNRQQAHLVLSFPGAGAADPERYALEVLLTVLAGPGGRLPLTLRERRALAFRVELVTVAGLDPGYLAVYVATTPERAEPLEAALRQELRRLVTAPLSEEEVRRARDHLIGVYETGLERRAALAEALALHEVYGLGYAEAGRYAERIAAVDAAAVQRAARRFLDEGRAVLAAVLPESLTPSATRRGLLSPAPPPTAADAPPKAAARPTPARKRR